MTLCSICGSLADVWVGEHHLCIDCSQDIYDKMQEVRICSKCGNEKKYYPFQKSKNKWGYGRWRCTPCEYKYSMSIENGQRAKTFKRIKKYRKNHKNEVKIRIKNYHIKNKDKINKYMNEYMKERYRNNNEYREKRKEYGKKYYWIKAGR